VGPNLIYMIVVLSIFMSKYMFELSWSLSQ